MRRPLWIWVLILPCVAAAVFGLYSLGQWQLSRYHEKLSTIKHFDEAQRKAKLPWEALRGALASPQALHFRKVQLEGRFLHQQFLWDNRTHHGRLGYELITPLQLPDGSLLFVNRGWIPMGASRSVLPQILPILGEVRCSGDLVLPSHLPSWMRAHFMEDDRWPRRILGIDLAQMAQAIGADPKRVLPWVVRLDPQSEYGFIREWVLTMMSPNRHLGYAFQWFAFALILAGGTVVLCVMDIRKSR